MTYRPHIHLAALPDVTYVVTPLPAGDGWWLPVERAIAITTGLLQRSRRSVLAHEIAHCEHDDHHWEDRRFLARRDRLAEDVAAHRLIPLDRLAEVLVWAEDVTTAAIELNVSDDLLVHRLKHLHPSERAVIRRRLEAAEPSV